MTQETRNWSVISWEFQARFVSPIAATDATHNYNFLRPSVCLMSFQINSWLPSTVFRRFRGKWNVLTSVQLLLDLLMQFVRWIWILQARRLFSCRSL
ncbi:unnamed protein product [Amoebophrya sp. A120]|nr:unnamed protein product [Amoebophrya sp. A120]|eukprot:GSA120T00004612001.1